MFVRRTGVKFPDVESRSAGTTLALFSHQKKTWPGSKVACSLLAPNSLDSSETVSEAKDLVVTLEKRTISYLSVSARIKVIDQFSQMTVGMCRWDPGTLNLYQS